MEAEDLEGLDRQVQLEAMRDWFFENFEDPAIRTPYDSREGGYIWIWGGPHDALEELEAKFGDVVTSDVIDVLSNEINEDGCQWAPVARPEDYDGYFVDDVLEIENSFTEFRIAIEQVHSLMALSVPRENEMKFHSLLFVNVIAALEAYLSDKFIKRVMTDDTSLRRCVENVPEFRKERVPLSQVYNIFDSIKPRTQQFLTSIVWHNLARVKPMYTQALDVDFGDIETLAKAIKIRHDLVHRNGRSRDGSDVVITPEFINRTIENCDELIMSIESQLMPF